MSHSRENHYVPQWYQRGFFEPGRNTLSYLDLTPPNHPLPDGSTVPGRSRFENPTSRCFVQRDLYSTFFGTAVNDEIERRLFGSIDASGARAVKAFAGSDPAEWHRHFEALFDYIDTQKVRTPKGLDWLRAQYPSLTQNELMREMQGIRMMNCTIWTEGVREIVSAEEADVKFIVTDHPVTVYNHAVAPTDAGSAYPDDPSIALKASQTIFPLNRDFCLILTNLEYARDRAANPLEKRTFARNFRHSLVRTDAFIRTRKLTGQEVSQVNAILKARARRYVAAGREEWLHPERRVPDAWRDLGAPLRPPSDELWLFGGEVFAKFEDGRVHYQDEFGRTEKPHDALRKEVPATLRAGDMCGCGSERPYKTCCETRPVHLRPSWSELSIRERNLALYRAAAHILGIDQGKTWTEIRRDLTDDKISDLYGVFTAFWPLETDLLQLLPKPDGRPRAVYTGAIHPALINEFAVGASLYFGELLVDHPFVHAGTMTKEYSPVENPRAYRQEVLKAVLLLFTLMPLVDFGLVNLVPDPCNFDFHLREQMMRMARERGGGLRVRPSDDERTFRVTKEDARRAILLAPPGALKRMLSKGLPGLEGVGPDDMLEAIDQAKVDDPLVTLQPDSLGGGKGGGQLTMMKLTPNFEIAMYLAQATGGSIVTDSPFRWSEITAAVQRRGGDPHGGLRELAAQIEKSRFAFPQEERDVVGLSVSGAFDAYSALMGDAFKYLINRDQRGAKPNFEAQLAARFARALVPTRTATRMTGGSIVDGKVRAALPAQGIQDNTVNRLLLMSSSEHHLARVPMAFFLEQPKP
jgi:hypothetical protein